MYRRLASVLLALAVAGCIQTADEPLLDDPREILGRTLTASLALRTAAVRVDAQYGNADMGDQAATAEGVVDLPSGELGFTAATADGRGGGSIIVVDGAAFLQSTEGRWTKAPMDEANLLGGALFGGQAAEPADIPAAILATLADPTTLVESKGVEDCEAGRCYRVAVVIAPERVWTLMLDLTGMGDFPGVEDSKPPAGQIPAIDLEILTATDSFLPIGLSLGTRLDATTVAIRVMLSRHNEEVRIEAPPDDMVDDQDFGFPDGGMDGLEPIPVPASAAPSFPDDQ
jgi:hypothetical protein